MADNVRRALTVVNLHSRRGEQADDYLAALAAGGLTLVRRECDSAQSVCDAIRAAQGAVDCVVLGGGDGTISGAAPALRETGLPLGILPLGTANDLARTLGLPDDPAQVAGVILAGQTRKIDLGDVNGHLFFNVASIGLTVDISRRLSKANKRWLGKLAYAWTAMRVASKTSRFAAVIAAGETTHRIRTIQIAIGNGRFYGGGMVVNQGASIDDHMLDVYSLELRSKWRLLLAARAFRDGEHEQIREVRTMRADALEIRTKRPRPVSADGEIVTETPARFSVAPQAVTVYVP